MCLQQQMRQMPHSPLPEQVDHLNQMLRGHDTYYGIAGESSVTAKGPSGRGTLLAQNTEQSELARRGPLGAIPTDQVAVPAA